MDFPKVLEELRAQQQLIQEAIFVIERLAAGTGGKRRGRPPKWVSALKAGGPEPGAPKKKRLVSAAARKRMAQAQKKRWAAKRAQAK